MVLVNVNKLSLFTPYTKKKLKRDTGTTVTGKTRGEKKGNKTGRVSKTKKNKAKQYEIYLHVGKAALITRTYPQPHLPYSPTPPPHIITLSLQIIFQERRKNKISHVM